VQDDQRSQASKSQHCVAHAKKRDISKPASRSVSETECSRCSQESSISRMRSLPQGLESREGVKLSISNADRDALRQSNSIRTPRVSIPTIRRSRPAGKCRTSRPFGHQTHTSTSRRTSSFTTSFRDGDKRIRRLGQAPASSEEGLISAPSSSISYQRMQQ